MQQRREMQFTDWVNVVAFLAIGALLGSAVFNMWQLVGTALWPLIIIIPLLNVAAFGFYLLVERIFNWIFPMGVQLAHHEQSKMRRPLAVVLGLPIGMVLGLIGTYFGLDRLVL